MAKTYYSKAVRTNNRIRRGKCMQVQKYAGFFMLFPFCEEFYRAHFSTSNKKGSLHAMGEVKEAH
jgi:hypothetical protein